MSKFNEIEKAIKSLNGGTYQKLMDRYLYRKYNYSNIQCLGTQEGTDKTTKGIPDTYILTKDGKYILIMYGTHIGSTSGLNTFNKIKVDIESCLQRFDDDTIHEIICCHNSSNLTVEQNQQLSGLFSNVKIIGLNTIADDLFYRYPNLAKEFLGISVDTGQIMSAEDFIEDNNKSVYETPLDVTLLGRDEEKSELLTLINENDVVVVEGPSGVGKTKLSLEACMDFSKSNDYLFYIIKNRNQDIFDDLQAYFSDNRNYIILVDDANQLTDLTLVLELIKENSSTKNIKLILTVRDYAKYSTIAKVRDVVLPVEYSVKELEESVVKDIIKKNLNINNEFFLEQISKIAKGNVRLAYMAGISSKKEGQFANIQNASEIFESYFKYAINDMTRNELMLMAIFAFVESFELTNPDSLVFKLSQVKNITSDSIKETCEKLHSAEIVDIYENLAAKFNDQNLTDYIIFYVFFKEKLYPLKELIELSYPVNQEKVVFHINTTIKLFYSEESMKYLSDSVKKIWKNNDYNNKELYDFANSFHSLIDDEVLSFLKSEISNEGIKQIDILSEQLTNKSSNCDDKILRILSGYKHSKNYTSALDLFVMYVNRNNQNAEGIKTAIVSGFGVDKDSYLNEYELERNVLQWLFDCYNTQPNDNVAFLCMHFAIHCLSYSFEFTESSYNSRNVQFGVFTIADCEGIRLLHSLAWNCLNSLYNNSKYYQYVYNLLLDYRPYERGVINSKNNLSKIRKFDSEVFENLFADSLDFSNVIDCQLVNKLAKTYGVDDTELSEFYSKWQTNMNYSTIKKLQHNILLTDSTEMEIAEAEWNNQLIEIFRGLSIDEIKDILIGSTNIKLDNEWEFYERLELIADSLEPKVFIEFAKLLIEFTPKNYRQSRIITRMISLVGYEETRKTVLSFDINERRNWFNSLVNNVDDDSISDEYCEEVIDGIKNNPILYCLDFETIVRVKEKNSCFLEEYIAALSNTDIPSMYHIVFNTLFRGKKYFKDDTDALIDFFDNIEQFKVLYKLAIKEKNNTDYDGTMFSAIIKRDKSFLTELLDLYMELPYQYHDEFSAFKNIWKLDNHQKLINDAVDYMFSSYKNSYNTFRCLKTFFNSEKGINNHQVEVFKGLVTKYIEDEKAIGCLMDVCEEWSKEQRFDITMYVLSLNNSLEMFKKCPVAPLPGMMSGSEVPYIERRIKELKEISEELQGAEYIEHRVFCKECIDNLQEYKKRVMMREFVYNY